MVFAVKARPSAVPFKQFLTERTPFLPSTLSCESKSLLESLPAGFLFRIGRVVWILLLLRASNEHRFIVRVLRAWEMIQAALPFS